MNCEINYCDWLPCGLSSFTINTGRTVIEDLEVTIENKGAVYQKTYTSDIFGDIEIQHSDFPNGFFNPYAGKFVLSIKIGCDYVLFCDEYETISFEIRNGSSEKNTLTCCPSGGESGASSACCVSTSIPFTNVTSTIVPYTGEAPFIQVAYLQDGVYVIDGTLTTVVDTGTQFEIDHGGAASGIIKLLK